MSNENSKLVYSTEKIFPKRGDSQDQKPVAKAIQANVRPAQCAVTVRLDRKARGGKSVTVIEGLRMPQKERDEFLRHLKAKLGTGGTFKNTSLEIQGDHRTALMAVFEKMGYRPKQSDG